MNVELLNKGLDFITSHPHYKRESGHLTKDDIREVMIKAWVAGLLNFVTDIDKKEIIGCFEAHVIKADKLWMVKSAYPKVEGVEEPVLFIDMVGKFREDYKIGFSDIMRIAYKAGEMGGAKKLYYRNFHKHYLYSLKNRKYNGELKPKFFIFNKNTKFLV